MTIARRKQFCPDVTPYYHCITRCVRRSFLCGHDKLTRKNFNHRRGWIEKHLLLLSNAFCIDLAGYSVMSNHYHVVLHVNQKIAATLSDSEVIHRWHKIYKGPPLIRRYLIDDVLTESELKQVHETIALWRNELTNISRFMGHLNESIARRANKEDNCKGRFWESRFKLQAILDLKALIATLCYVDLNPVRAKMAKTPEASRFTSVRKRLQSSHSALMRFASNTARALKPHANGFAVIPISFKDYLELLDYTGRQVKRGKKGTIDDQAPSVMARLGYSAEQWADAQQPKLTWTQRALGNTEAIKDYCAAIGQQWIWSRVF